MARYPMPQAWPVAEKEAMNCRQLGEALERAQQTQRQIADIAAGRDPQSRPPLYSTAKTDADRASQARIGEIQALMQAKHCSA